MDETSILDMCSRLGWKAKVRGGWIATSCPFSKDTHEKGKDAKPSFGIFVDPSGESSYNCLACGKKGQLSGLPTVLQFMDLINDDQAEILRNAISHSESFSSGARENNSYLVDLAPALSEYTLERFQNLRKSHIASRGITAESVHKYELRWDRAENRLLFPIRDSEGRLVGIRGRYIGPNDPDVLRYREYVELSPSGRSVKKFGVWFGVHMSMLPDKALILVEGEIDAIRLKQVLPKANVLASIGASITREQLKSLVFPSKGIIAFFDNDMAGKKAVQTIIDEARQRNAGDTVYRIKEYLGCSDVDEIIVKHGREGVLRVLSSLDKAT